MFTKLKHIRISQYQVDDDPSFYIEIIRSTSGVEVWLGHSSYGIKHFIFGTGTPLTDVQILDSITLDLSNLMWDYTELHITEGGDVN